MNKAGAQYKDWPQTVKDGENLLLPRKTLQDAIH